MQLSLLEGGEDRKYHSVGSVQSVLALQGNIDSNIQSCSTHLWTPFTYLEELYQIMKVYLPSRTCIINTFIERSIVLKTW